MELKGKRALVVGAGKSGKAAARLLLREGAQVALVDQKADLGALGTELAAEGVKLQLGGLDATHFTAAELIVTSPGVPLAHPSFQAARDAGIPVIGELELGFRFLREPVLAITGTNGKSTTTALTGHICATAGLRTFTGGNLGKPLCERVLAGGEGDVAVVECSSFQLESVDTFHARGAAFLNLTPDHLDRYADHEAYGQAKARIFRNQVNADFSVINAHSRDAMRLSEGGGAVRWTFGHGSPQTLGIRDLGGKLVLRHRDDRADEIFTVENRALRGAHNRENAMAAVLLTRQFGVRREDVQRGLDTFPGLPHRLEFVREHQGVEFINDSKATNVDSTLVALKAFEQGVLLIAGGRGKGAPYGPLVELAQGRIRAVLTIGEDAPKVQQAFEGVVPVVACRTLEVAIERATQLAHAGDTVLLSPACASYDQFDDFEHRGRRFKEVVGAL